MTYQSLIGIHGPINSGKDIVADYLIKLYPNKLRRYAFAKPIKEACKVLFGFTQAQLEDRTLKEQVDPFWGFTPRAAMQKLGTEYGRDLMRPDVWIMRAAHEVLKNSSEGFATIITDVRFQNEVNWIRSYPQAVMLHLTVPNLIRDEKYNHSSENGINLLDEDHLIINDHSLGINNLYTKIDLILDQLIER